MPIQPSKINLYTLTKLPAAFLCGVRVKTLTEEKCQVTVKHRWINQNPFRSMFWAVQGMAAELSTGALVISCIKDTNASISMLVLNNRASFLKKATGRIRFTCHDGLAIKEAIQKTMETGKGQTCWMTAEGIDAEGDVVSHFEFEWTVKLKNRP